MHNGVVCEIPNEALSWEEVYGNKGEDADTDDWESVPDLISNQDEEEVHL